jgi:hypothetical protein
MERRNSFHELILHILNSKVKERELKGLENEHIDLYVNVDDPENQLAGLFSIEDSYLKNVESTYFPGEPSGAVSFVFEAKSSDDRIILRQTRKAVSQLYEYRYRYRNRALASHSILVLALQNSPAQFSWIVDYLLYDRHIAICWIDDEKRLLCPSSCYPVLSAFVDAVDDVF